MGGPAAGCLFVCLFVCLFCKFFLWSDLISLACTVMQERLLQALLERVE